MLTNGCGGLKEGWQPGQPVLISDHINLTGTSPIVGANFVDLTDLYSPRLRAMCKEIDPSLDEGVYVQFPGPHYETPAEVRMAGVLGGHLVGMSTTLEAIAAREAGMEILGISLVTNLAAGLSGEPLDHAEVLEAGKAAASRMGGLLSQVVATDLMRVLVTGAAGSLGRVVTVGLADLGHEVVGLDLVPAPEGTHVRLARGRLRRRRRGRRGLRRPERLDAVVHLAGAPEECSLPEELTSHVVTTAALLDAMVAHRVPRIVYASSNHAVGRTPARRRRAHRATPSPAPTPTTASPRSRPRRCMRLFADRHGIDAVSCRIGSFLEEPTSVARPLDVALPRRRRPHGRGGAHRARAGLRGPLRHQRQHPRAGGTSSPAGAWATSRRTTRRSSPTGIPRRAEDDEAEAAHVGGPFALDAVPPPRAGLTPRRPIRAPPLTWSALQVRDWSGDQPEHRRGRRADRAHRPHPALLRA